MAKKLRQLYGSRKPKSYRPAHNHVIHTPSFAHSLNGTGRRPSSHSYCVTAATLRPLIDQA